MFVDSDGYWYSIKNGKGQRCLDFEIRRAACKGRACFNRSPRPVGRGYTSSRPLGGDSEAALRSICEAAPTDAHAQHL